MQICLFSWPGKGAGKQGQDQPVPFIAKALEKQTQSVPSSAEHTLNVSPVEQSPALSRVLDMAHTSGSHFIRSGARVKLHAQGRATGWCDS